MPSGGWWEGGRARALSPPFTTPVSVAAADAADAADNLSSVDKVCNQLSHTEADHMTIRGTNRSTLPCWPIWKFDVADRLEVKFTC